MKLRYLFIIAFVFACINMFPSPSSASPFKKALTAVPRAVGRNYANLFTFKHPWLAVQQWAVIGGIAFDEHTTFDASRRCATCYEKGFAIYRGDRDPSLLKIVTDGVLLSGIETTYIKYAAEVAHDDNSKAWSNSYSILPVAFIATHAAAGHSNMDLK